jgi:predicted ribosome quality control (RQC) complex YloA/Tae2 family protein
VLSSLDECQTSEDIDAVRQELYAEGYLKRKAVKGKQPKRPSKKLEPMAYCSSDGLTILVGRNNAQNDELTLKTALPSDMWFHTKNIPGSHVILRCAGQVPPESSVMEAAKLAAYHSQVKGETATPVDYCLRKYVKKPSGSRPGMVIYETNKTAYVGCTKEEAESYRAETGSGE